MLQNSSKLFITLEKSFILESHRELNELIRIEEELGKSARMGELWK
jgi:enolase